MNEIDTLKYLIDLHTKLDAEIDAYWNLFISVNLAISGWLVTKSHPLTLVERLIACVSYICFGGFFLLTFYSNEPLINAVTNDIRMLSDRFCISDAMSTKSSLSICKSQLETFIQLKTMDNFNWSGFWIYIYSFSVVAVTALIYSDGGKIFNRHNKGQQRIVKSVT